jgi:hypothetical protein
MIIHNPILTGSLTLNNVNLSTGNLVTTGSNTFVGNQILSGSLTVSGSVSATGTLTAQTLVVQTITSSVSVITGSTNFGTLAANTHTFTGSILASGSIGIGTTPSTAPIEVLSTSDYSFRHFRTVINSKSLISLYDSPTAANANYVIIGVDPTGSIVGYAVSGSFISTGTNGTGVKRDLIIHNYDAKNIILATNNTERMRVDSSGNVGIGVTPTYALDVANSSSPSLRVRNGALGGTATLLLETANDFSGTCQTYIKCIGTTSNGQSTLTFGTAGASGDATATERMRLTSAGRLGIGTNSPGDYVLNVTSNSTNNATYPHQIAIFGNSASGASRGYLYIGSSAGIDWLMGKDTSGAGDYRFNLSLYTGEQRMVLYTNGNYSFAGSNVSDIRLKSNINTLSLNALDKISQFVPKSYTMNDHPDQIRYGFIAQEIKEITPDLISGTEGEKEYLGLDYNGVLTLTVKALQELKAEFDEYKTTHP